MLPRPFRWRVSAAGRLSPRFLSPPGGSQGPPASPCRARLSDRAERAMRIPGDADRGAELHQRLVPLAGPGAEGRAGSDGEEIFFSFDAEEAREHAPCVA